MPPQLPSDVGAILAAIDGTPITPALTTNRIGIDVEGCHRWLVTKTDGGRARVTDVASAAALDDASDVTIVYQDEATFIKLLIREM